MSERAREINLDGLVGPTHHYGGLSIGNVASQAHRHRVSHPKRAALQGLEKIKRLADLGVEQAVLPPHDRPDVAALRRLGFTGSDADVIRRAARDEPALLSACCSASPMWAANAATVSPGADTADDRAHFTPANLAGNLHRAIEAPFTAALLKSLFDDEALFAHHEPLPPTPELGDEGAANHMRFCPDHAHRGVEVFVYGRPETGSTEHEFPARQSLAASRAVARLHGLDEPRTLFVRQSPEAIAAGAFHNDVVAIGHRNVLLYHERAFEGGDQPVKHIQRAYDRLGGGGLDAIEIKNDRLSLPDAVSTYLFNSQIIDLPGGRMSLICPVECAEHDNTRNVVEAVLAGDNPIESVEYVDLRQSMRNGGGPACLRLRVVLTEPQLNKMHAGVRMTPDLYQALTVWVAQHYRDELSVDDLGDPSLLDESRTALDELTRLLDLGTLYAFQR